MSWSQGSCVCVEGAWMTGPSATQPHTVVCAVPLYTHSLPPTFFLLGSHIRFTENHVRKVTAAVSISLSWSLEDFSKGNWGPCAPGDSICCAADNVGLYPLSCQRKGKETSSPHLCSGKSSKFAAEWKCPRVDTVKAAIGERLLDSFLPFQGLAPILPLRLPTSLL